jgi:hypothetical protein
MWDIKPGDEVVCVDAGPVSDGVGIWFPLRRGCRYTVAGVTVVTSRFGETGPCVELVGVANPANPTHQVFALRRFRPVRKRTTETGMSILRGILDRENDGVRAPEKEKA